MGEKVVFIGGNRVDANFPAVYWPKRQVEKAGYNVSEVIDLVEGFQKTGLETERQILDSELEDGPKHLVGYCAGGVLALDYRDHTNVESVTVYDTPSGINVNGEDLQIEGPILDEEVFLIYADSISEKYRLKGNYPAVEIRGADHEFSGRENDLAESVVRSLDYHTGKASFEEVSQRLLDAGFSSAYKSI